MKAFDPCAVCMEIINSVFTDPPEEKEEEVLPDPHDLYLQDIEIPAD